MPVFNPDGGEQQLIGGDDLPPPPGEPLPAPTIWTDREYVYGPDYVDEFIAQFDRAGNIIYMLQDANYNVVALVDGTGAMLEQYTYEPYGTLVAVERDERATTIVAGFVNRVGHQGLFFDRFDGTYDQYSLDTKGGESGPALDQQGQGPNFTTGAKGLYYNRNRFYSPSLGRFTTRDPNETALPIITALLMNGDIVSVFTSKFSAQAFYADGQNLYVYESNNPIKFRDPAGLMSYGEILVAGAQAAWIGATAYSAISDVRGYVRMFREGVQLHYILEEMLWDAVFYVANEKIIGAIFKRLGKIAKEYGKGRKAIVEFVKTMCFPSGTMILMADGTLKPIEQVRVGDRVLCDYDPHLHDCLDVSTVIHTFAGDALELVDLSFEFEGDLLTVSSTPEHPFYSSTRNDYVKAIDLRDGDVFFVDSDKIARLVFAERRSTQERVYNFEVDGAHNYLVTPAIGKFRLLVHNIPCGIIKGGARPKTDAVTYIMNVDTGEMFLGGSGMPHFQIWSQFAQGQPWGKFVGGFADFVDGKFVAAEISGTFTGTQAMREVAVKIFETLVGK